MKKILTSILLLFVATTSFAQMSDDEQKYVNPSDTKQLCGEVDNGPVKHRAYINPSTSWTPGYKPSYSLEAGTWGVTSYTSFGASVDAVVVDHRVQYWLGAKAYYTAWQNETLSYMFYISPKVNANNGHTLLEYGANQNYTISNDFLFGVTLGSQLDEDGYTTTFLSLGIVYLKPKK